MTPITAGETILQAIDYVLKTYPENYDRITKLKDQADDLVHIIEFTPLDIQRGYKYAKQLQDIRRERRILKDDNELLRPMYDFLSQGSSQAFRNGFANALQRARHREKALPERVYSPRSEAFKVGEVEPCE